jgi:hypothetical protein
MNVREMTEVAIEARKRQLPAVVQLEAELMLAATEWAECKNRDTKRVLLEAAAAFGVECQRLDDVARRAAAQCTCGIGHGLKCPMGAP